MKNAVTRACAWVSFALAILVQPAQAQSLEIYAGGGKFVDIPGNTIGLQPGGMATTPDGYLYVTDINGRLMRLNTATGLVTAMPATPGGIAANLGYTHTLAVDFAGHPHVYSNGALNRIEADGTLTNLGPLYVDGTAAFGPDGSLYVAMGYSQIYARRPSGAVEVVAGLDTSGFSGDGGPAINAELDDAQGVAVAPNGDLYIADSQNNRIRVVDHATGVISTFAGTGDASFNGNGVYRTLANIGTPASLAFDASGNLYVTTQYNGRILKVDATSGLVTSVGGGGSGVDGSLAVNANIVPRLIAIDPAGDIYFSDWRESYQKIRKIDATTGLLSLAIGYDSFYFCGENVPARQVCLAQPFGIDVDASGTLLFADAVYGSVRKIDPATTILSTWKKTTETPINIEHDAAGNTFVASWGGYQIDRYDAITGGKTVVAGRGSYGYSGDGGLATQASLASPGDVAVDAAGNLYITDSSNSRVRKVSASTGIITALATVGGADTIEIDPAGNLVVGGSCRISRVDPSTGAVTPIAGTGTCISNPAGGTPAVSTAIGGNRFAIDANGNIFVGWQSPHLYRIDAVSGLLTRVPAPAGGLATPEGIHITNVSRMEFDAAGNLYISQQESPRQFIFRVTGLTDSTPPVIEPVVNGTAGPGGWYRGDVHVSWVVSDPESGVASQAGCTSSAVTTDTAGVTFTCTATSIGGTSTESVTIRRDTVAPTLTFAQAVPAADADGWNHDDVHVSFDAADALSGVFSTSVANPLVFSEEGAGQTQWVVVTDNAGNTASFTSPAINIDRSAPAIEEHVAGTLGTNGWYRSDVAVSFTVSDDGSPIVSREGCDATSVTTDTAGITVTCTAVSHGGSTSKSITVKRDATPPSLEFGALSPAPAANGWNGGDVSVPFVASDATSGVQSTSSPSPLSFTASGAGQSQQVTVTDNAGNIAQAESPVVNIDRSPPSVQPMITGTLGNNGWYTSDVHVSWAVGEEAGGILAQNGCEDAVVGADTSGVTFSCAVSSAGGSASSSITVKRDATPPTLSFGAFSPAPNSNGWNKTDVSVPFTADDTLSGIASTSSASPLVISAEGAGVTGQVTVTDNAGNSSTFTSGPRNIDKTAPVVTLSMPEDGVVYGLYQNLTAAFACADVSLVSCTGTTANGATINTSSGGAKTFKVTAKDSVAQTTSVTHSYSVATDLNFTGFIGAAAPPDQNVITRGSLVPIRWQLPDGHGGFVSNPASFSSATVQSFGCYGTAVPYDEVATGSAGLSFDATTNTFTYNWQTSASWTGCRKVVIKFKDYSAYALLFKLQ